MEGYTHNEYSVIESEEEDDEDLQTQPKKIKYTILKEEEFYED